MVEYKTLVVPVISIKRQGGKYIHDKDNLLGIANGALEPVSRVIISEGQKGWHLHSCFEAPLTIKKKISLWNRFKNWFFFGDRKSFGDSRFCMLVFQREV